MFISLQFLYISLGSLSELETQIEISGNLKYHNNQSEFEDKIKYIRNLITGLIRKLNNS
jgi:four helix bundle protein